MRHRAALAAALLLVAVGSFAVLRTRARADGHDAAAASGPAPSDGLPTEVPPGAVRHRDALGTELTYSLAYESDGTMGIAAESARLSSRFRARLVRTVLADAERGGHLVLYRFLEADVVVSVNETNAGAAASDVASALGEGVITEEAADGHVLSLRASPGASSLALSFARALLAELQIALPERPAPTWTARETDTNGDCVATYAIVGDPVPANGTLALKKTKRPARSTNRPGSSAEKGEWAALTRGESRTLGATEIDFDVRHGAMKELASELTVESMLGALQVATTRTKLDAERMGERLLDPPALAALLASVAAVRAGEPAPLDARSPVDLEAAKTHASKHWLGTSTLPELVTALRASEGRAQDARHFDLFLKVHAFTFLHPEECGRVAALLAPLAPAGSSFQVLLAALGATGSREAQAALVSALGSAALGAEAKKHVIATLGMLTVPGEDAEAALRAIRDGASPPELAATAALSLGIMAKSLARRSPARANAIVDDALARAVADERDEPRLLLDLSILGNTGSPRIQHDVLRWSHAASAAVREQAAFALRLVRTDEAEARLLEVLAGDEDAALRSRTATALSYREGTARSLEVQRARVAADPDPAVRAALLGNLYAMRELFPDALAVLEERRRADPDAKVKQIADGLLGSDAHD